MAGGILIPISMFWFGWTARESVHWIVPIIGSSLFAAGIFLLFQAGLKYVFSCLARNDMSRNSRTADSYLPDCYPRYVASVLAGNDFFRSMLGASFPIYGTGE